VEHFIAHYGYIAVLLGTLIEGGTLLTMAGFAAHRGDLHLVPWVILAGTVGSLVDGLFWFLVARRYGVAVVARRHEWRRGLRRMARWYHQHPTLMIVGARFLPGARTVSFIAAGLSRIRGVAFAPLNALGAAIWATTIALAGYLSGQLLELLVGDVQRIEGAVFLTLMLVSLGWWIARWLRRHRLESA
jgi:membrane protein DedA with SNARE-associated domain